MKFPTFPGRRSSNIRRVRLFHFLLALGLFLPAASQAQDPTGAQIGTEQDVVRRSEETTEGQRIPFRLTDPELGEIDLVSRAPRPKTFTVATDQSFFYTTNAFLTPNGEQDDVFWNGRLVGSWVPYSTRNFTPRVTFEQNFFRYGDFSRLDFDSQSLQFDMKYDFNPNDTTFANLSYTGARLYSPRGSTGEFYRYGLVNASATHIWPLRGLPIQIGGTLGATWRHGDPSDFDRATAYLDVVLIYSPLDTLHCGIYVRPEGQAYLHDPLSHSRRDFNFSAGANAVWTPVDYFSLGVTASFTGNYSSVDPLDYDVFLPSVVASGRFSF